MPRLQDWTTEKGRSRTCRGAFLVTRGRSQALQIPKVQPERGTTVKQNIEIVSVTWHQGPPPGQFQVFFEDGREEVVPGDRPKAQAVAGDLGFVLVTDEGNLVEWVRES
jgi:hypothetical protein